MATKTEIAFRVNRDLKALFAGVVELYEISEEWNHLSEIDRVTDSLNWDHLMASYLTELHEYYRTGKLSEEQHESYERLQGRLKEAMPIIETLNFYRPPVPLDH